MSEGTPTSLATLYNVNETGAPSQTPGAVSSDESCEDGPFKNLNPVLCFGSLDSRECCLNFALLDYCEPDQPFAAGAALDDFCAYSCGFCVDREGGLLAERIDSTTFIEYNAAKSNPRLIIVIILSSAIMGCICAIIGWILIEVAKISKGKNRLVSFLSTKRRKRRFLRFVVVSVMGLLLLIAGTGVSVFNFSTPQVFVSPIDIKDFSMQSEAASTEIEISYSLSIRVDDTFMDYAVEMQEVSFPIFYNHKGLSRSIGTTTFYTTQVQAGDTASLAGDISTLLALDPVWSARFLEDYEAGTLNLELGPKLLPFECSTTNSIFQWVAQVNQQEFSYDYFCSVNIQTTINKPAR